ncbi:MAG: cell division protein FtsZ [Flavobacteriales bacterium]|nr:cell division protein FtsZ [Flavobacteriales bacterium]
MIEDGIQFNLPKNRSSVIKVIGVGGGGSNAVNHMTRVGVNGVDFIVCNTDAQALYHSPVPNKVQLGASLTEGLGAGADPEIGHRAAEESIAEITKMLENGTKMCFVTAGMGGGTGTGAAPVIAKAAKEMGILTVGIITSPFSFEGNIRAVQAEKGISEMRDAVDSLIVINNDKLRQVYGDLGFRNAFSKADEVLAGAAKGIAEVITNHYTQNIDLRDAKTVLENSGSALFGTGSAEGEDRASLAVSAALDSPLLNDNHIKGAQNILLLLTSGEGDYEITIDEIGEITDHIQREAGGNANVIMGIGGQNEEGSKITCTIIATGFPTGKRVLPTDKQDKVVHTLDEDKQESMVVQEESNTKAPKTSIEEIQEETEDRIIMDLGDFEEKGAIDTVNASSQEDEVLDTAADEVVEDFLDQHEFDVQDELGNQENPREGFPQIPEEDAEIFDTSLNDETFEEEEATVHVLEWDISEEAPDQKDLETETEEDEPVLLSSAEETEPVIHNTENSSTLEIETDQKEGGLEVSPWDLFSQTVDPEEEEIELVIVDEVEQETETPIPIPEVSSEFDQPAPAPMKRPEGIVEQQSQNESTPESTLDNEDSAKSPSQLTSSTFTLEDIEGDGFALNLEEIEASERPSLDESNAEAETSYEAFDLSLSEVSNLHVKAQQEGIENSLTVPSPEFHTSEIATDEAQEKEEEESLTFEVKTVEVTKAPEVEVEVDNHEEDMDRPISAVKAANAGDFPTKVKDRISRLQAFQYPFKGINQIEESERVPAYMRQGVDVDLDHKSEDKPSNIGVDSEGNIRTNNSFLHDNVD